MKDFFERSKLWGLNPSPNPEIELVSNIVGVECYPPPKKFNLGTSRNYFLMLVKPHLLSDMQISPINWLSGIRRNGESIQAGQFISRLNSVFLCPFLNERQELQVSLHENAHALINFINPETSTESLRQKYTKESIKDPREKAKLVMHKFHNEGLASWIAVEAEARYYNLDGFQTMLYHLKTFTKDSPFDYQREHGYIFNVINALRESGLELSDSIRLIALHPLSAEKELVDRDNYVSRLLSSS